MWFWNTGIFTDRDKVAVHLKTVPTVLVPPRPRRDNTIVYGVNHDTLTSDQIIIIEAHPAHKLPIPSGQGIE